MDIVQLTVEKMHGYCCALLEMYYRSCDYKMADDVERVFVIVVRGWDVFRVHV